MSRELPAITSITQTATRIHIPESVADIMRNAPITMSVHDVIVEQLMR
jgi:hypothetical protein